MDLLHLALPTSSGMDFRWSARLLATLSGVLFSLRNWYSRFLPCSQHLWKAASTYRDGNPTRTPQQWFEQMRHRLRHGFVKPLIRELHRLSHYRSTSKDTCPILRQVPNYLKTHLLEHIEYRKFKKVGLPIGSSMVESACKWLIQQRFKGVGMRWSEDGFNHLLHLRLAWINQRFDPLFGEQPLVPVLYSPKR